MPENEDARNVSVQDFVAEIAGSTGFTYDKIILQLSRCQDNGQDFLCNHGEARYRVPLASINEFFETHEKPIPKMTAEQEVLYLRKKLTEAEKTIEELTGITKDTPQGATRQDIMKGTATKDQMSSMFYDKQLNRPPEKRKEAIAFEPPPHVEEQKKMRLDEIQEMIKEEVKDKQPFEPRKEAESGRVPSGARSPKAPPEQESAL